MRPRSTLGNLVGGGIAMGQFCELPDDVAFTVEYSIRSAQAAVYQRKFDRRWKSKS